MPDPRSTTRDRALPALAAIAVQLAIGYALVIGLGVRLPGVVDEDLKLFTAAPPTPPPPPVRTVPPPKASKRPEGAAAPPNLRSRRTEIVAPPPVVPLVPPPPVVVAPERGTGADPSQGAAPRAGPGSGAGGEGNGTGSGGSGDGNGGGGRDETPPRLLKGRIKGSDYPEASAAAGLGGMVSVRYVVEVDGRVSDCRVTRSSGQRDLDETTCRLIVERFRYRPWLDERGRPVASTVVQDHDWIAPEPDLPPMPDRPRRRGFHFP